MKQYPLEFMPKQYNGRDPKEIRRVGEINECGVRIVRYLNSQMLSSDSKVREFGSFEVGRVLKMETELVSDVFAHMGEGTNGIIIEK